MRIWHEELLPKLCQKHLCAMWREGLGCYKIISEDKKGYRNHPAVKEFEGNTLKLFGVLEATRNEMLRRGYKPKLAILGGTLTWSNDYKPWQTLEEQIEVLKSKSCQCQV